MGVMNMKSGIKTSIMGHVVAAILAGLTVMTLFASNYALETALWTADVFIGRSLIPAIIFAAIFLAGHMVLHSYSKSQTVFYCLLGSLALNAAFYGSFGPEIIAKASDNGIGFFIAGAVFLTGSMIGFAYRRFAGLETEGDDPAKLASLMEHGVASAAADNPDRYTQTAPAILDATARNSGEVGMSADLAYAATDTAEYYNGPLQVKTSANAVFIAGLIGGGVFAITDSLLVVAMDVFWGTDFGRAFFNAYFQNFASGNGLLGYVGFGLLMGILVFPIPVYLCHKFCQSRGRNDINFYAGVGAAAPIIIGLCLFVIGLLITMRLVLPLAVAMFAYRRLAGLEPAGLPEDIEVDDRRALIGADHVRRKYSRVT
jgi:hypothetical protein